MAHKSEALDDPLEVNISAKVSKMNVINMSKLSLILSQYLERHTLECPQMNCV